MSEINSFLETLLNFSQIFLVIFLDLNWPADKIFFQKISVSHKYLKINGWGVIHQEELTGGTHQGGIWQEKFSTPWPCVISSLNRNRTSTKICRPFLRKMKHTDPLIYDFAVPPWDSVDKVVNKFESHECLPVLEKFIPRYPLENTPKVLCH